MHHRTLLPLCPCTLSLSPADVEGERSSSDPSADKGTPASPTPLTSESISGGVRGHRWPPWWHSNKAEIWSVNLQWAQMTFFFFFEILFAMGTDEVTVQWWQVWLCSPDSSPSLNKTKQRKLWLKDKKWLFGSQSMMIYCRLQCVWCKL